MFRDGQWSEVAVPDDDWRSSVEASVIAYLDAVTAGREPRSPEPTGWRRSG
jgi:hypothetical protein